MSEGLRLHRDGLAEATWLRSQGSSLPSLEGCAGQAHIAVRLDEVGLQCHIP